MKICLYSPYLPKHKGGGEKYFFDVARLLAKKHQVYIGLSQAYLAKGTDFESLGKEVLADYQEFLGESLAGIKTVLTPLGSNAPWWQKLLWTRHWDVLYYLTDGSLFFSLARKNVLHVQFPLILDKSGLVERLKLASWTVKNTNSYFTKKIIETSWPVKIDQVHQPMVSIASISKLQKKHPKKKIILNVGRFFSHIHSKRQDVLVGIFKQLLSKHPKQLKDWQLVLVGGVEDKSYFNKVKALAKNLPIKIYDQVSREELLSFYAQASVYWHATGFEVNENQHPEKVEHFGISTLEALTFGCAPVVVGKGGQPEVLGDSLNHLMWQTDKQCQEITLGLVKDEKKLKEVSLLAKQRAKNFSQDRFERVLFDMVS